MRKEEALQLAEEAGFSHSGIFPTEKMSFRQDVRDMCAVGKCKRYNKSWSCPPACGTLEDSKNKAAQYSWGVLLQMTAEMEDDFDIEAMTEAEHLLKQNFRKYLSLIDPQEDYLAMTAGSCTICKECTYPDAPCRFPDKMYSSMEAYGLLVLEVCQLADTPYYYGPGTLTYSCCVLFK